MKTDKWGDDSKRYIIRQAKADDIELLDKIHAENMRNYVEKVYPWNPQLFRACFIPENYQVIEKKRQILGFIKVVTSKTDIYLAEIQIDRQHQKQGIGTNLIQSIIKQAQSQNKKLWLKIVKGNPAEKLYARLGFTVFEESSTHKKMRK